ncbi:MAG: putative exported protein [Bacteroidota bacterium]|jgi:hypothetical protein|nr:putative exported protein [Bacteroidota bacterium]
MLLNYFLSFERYSLRSVFFTILFFILLSRPRVSAQIVIEEEPKRLYYEFAIKRITDPKQWKNFRDVFHKDKLLMGKNRILGGISYNTGRVLVTGSDGKTKEEWRQAIAFNTRIRFYEQFSFNTTFYVDFNKRAHARWISDFSYTLARYHYKLYKFNYGYENYMDNKYTDNRHQIWEKFLEGYYFISYNYGFSETFRNKVAFDNTTNLKIVPFARYAFRYRDELEREHGSPANGKATLGLALRYTIIKNIYVEGAAYYYPEEHKRQAWDPDYSYGFGYFDWRSFRLSLTYGNWAINRWPGSKTYYPSYGFLDGQFRIVANWIW